MKALNNIKKRKFSKEDLAIILIILLGGFLRLYKIRDYIVFLGDEGRDALVAYEIMHGNLTLLGPTSSVGGFFLGPIYYYMMAPFLWLTRYDPVGPSIMVALIGLVTIYLVYRFGKEIFNAKAGIIAALLYAISPTVIIYSHSSWNPNVFPFFTISSLFALYLGIKNKKWWLFIFSGFLMGVNLQIHYLATFVGAIMFFYVTFVDFSAKKEWFIKTLKRYGLMIIGFLVGFAPFLAFEARHQFANSQNIIKFIFTSKDTGVATNVFLNISNVFERLFAGLTVSFPNINGTLNYDPNIIKAWFIIGILIGFISIGFFIFQFGKKIKDREIFQKYFLVFVWMFVGIFLFLFYKKSIYDYYLGFLFPIPFLLIGFFSSFILEKYKRIGFIAVCVGLILMIGINLKFSPIMQPGNKLIDQMELISNFVMSKTGGQPYNFALITGGNSDHAYRYFMTLAGKEPITIQYPGIDPDRKTVTKQLFVVCESLPCEPLGNSLWEIAGFGKADIAQSWDVSVVKVYKLVPSKEDE